MRRFYLLKGKFPETTEQSTKSSPCPKRFEGVQRELFQKFPLARPPFLTDKPQFEIPTTKHKENHHALLLLF